MLRALPSIPPLPSSLPPAPAQIVDLGVSAELGRVFTRVQIGTPHYMAPEMWQRKAYSYSAGENQTKKSWALPVLPWPRCPGRAALLRQRGAPRVPAGCGDPRPSRRAAASAGPAPAVPLEPSRQLRSGCSCAWLHRFTLPPPGRHQSRLTCIPAPR